MLSIKYLREIRSTAELDLQQRIGALLQANPMVAEPLAFSFNLKPLCAPRWHLVHRDGALWLYRSCESLLSRKPVAVLSAA